MDNTVYLKEWKVEDYHYNEAMKTLRTNLLFSGNGIQTIMVSSAVPSEGKSETTFQMALSLAQLGKSVLLIDADIRKSVLVSRYQIDRKVDGLSQYLSGQRSRDEVIYKTNVPNLSMIFSGPYAPNPAELLEEPLFEALVAWARENYDYIVIDTPPIGSVIDGAIIGRSCDGMIAVIGSGETSYRVLQKAKAQMDKCGCRILGTVLNKVDVRQSGYYYYGKYGKYSKYYEKEKE